MHGWPMHRSRCKKPLQSQKTGASSQTDPYGIAIVCSGHSRPSGQALFPKCDLGVIPRNAKEKYQEAKAERATEQRDDSENPECCFVRYRRVVSVEKVREAIAKGKNYIKGNNGPGGPKRKPFPRNRASRFRAKIHKEENQRGKTQASQEDHRPKVNRFSGKRRLLLFAPPVVGNFNKGAEAL